MLKRKQLKPKVIPKTEAQIIKLREKLISSFIFGGVDDNELSIILSAMEERKFNINDIVIREGDIGYCLYVVESGRLICTKKIVIYIVKLGRRREAKTLKRIWSR